MSHCLVVLHAAESTSCAEGWLIYSYGAPSGQGHFCCGQRQSGEGSCKAEHLGLIFQRADGPSDQKSSSAPGLDLHLLVSEQSVSSSTKQEFRR